MIRRWICIGAMAALAAFALKFYDFRVFQWRHLEDPSYSSLQGLIERAPSDHPGDHHDLQGLLGFLDDGCGEDDGSYKQALLQPLSTFSADVDTASYAIVRSCLQRGLRPDPASVRIEEMINSFAYDLPAPPYGEVFSVTSELTDCPWNEEALLLRLAVKTESLDKERRPACRLVFLVDVSGSMDAPLKLPLLKESLKALVGHLREDDRIAIVTYAGSSGLALPATAASERKTILAAIENLRAGGSTNGQAGLSLAYKIAQESGDEGTINRVILATDGDFNVGLSSAKDMKALIEEKRRSGIALSVLGFGRYASNDATMEALADNGDGNYASIDSLKEACRVLVKESGSTLSTVAKDVKFQVAFQPARVEKYRLLGYKNRRLADHEFDDDKRDAGDVGAGHSVTVLYEVVPHAGAITRLPKHGSSAGLATLRLRYKQPTDDQSVLKETAISAESKPLGAASRDHRWAVAVTEFGLSLDGDPEASQISLEQAVALAHTALRPETPDDAELIDLMLIASELMEAGH